MDKDYLAPNVLGESSGGNDENCSGMINYMFNRNLQQQKQWMPQQQQHQPYPSGFGATMKETQHLLTAHQTCQGGDDEGNIGNMFFEETEDQENDDNNSVQLRFLGEEEDKQNTNVITKEVKSKRKRARTSKTIEEVESQRMTHIAVERNRRKQMNEHLSVLKSLMPGSYVQRGDQASIIGGAIEFVRELEQLLQCLESQKRRRIGDMTTTSSSSPIITGNGTELDGNGGLQEETAENKSYLADVEVKLLGFDAMIKILSRRRLSRRRPGQLIKTIAALEDLHLSILHTNITSMEQTVLYSFNVKVTSETRFTADDIASSIQQIFSFIHANTTV